MLSPMHISFALAFDTCTDPRQHLGAAHFDSEAGQKVCRWLRENALVDDNGPTDKLTAWVEHLCRQPLPECQWIVPAPDAT